MASDDGDMLPDDDDATPWLRPLRDFSLLLVAVVVAVSLALLTAPGPAGADPEAQLSGVLAADGGTGATCARNVAGEVLCWGDNEFGQLGDDTYDDRVVPTKVIGPDGSTLSGVRQLAVGGNNACVILADRRAACWGANGKGQIGDGSATTRTRATLVEGVGGVGFLQQVIQISVGAETTCARLASGQARCWGHGNHGQLGNGTTGAYNPTPVVVQTRSGSGPLTGVTEVAVGTTSVCARLASGQARCWGANDHGQVGDTSTSERRRPAVVRAAT